jgi:hypothetical protein
MKKKLNRVLSEEASCKHSLGQRRNSVTVPCSGWFHDNVLFTLSKLVVIARDDWFLTKLQQQSSFKLIWYYFWVLTNRQIFYAIWDIVCVSL